MFRSHSTGSDGQHIGFGGQPQHPARGTLGAVLASEPKVHRPGGSTKGVPQAIDSKLILSEASDWKVNLSGVPSAR
jgi:hypothetical protein